MDQRTNQMLFALLRSAIRGTQLTEEERNNYSSEMLREMTRISTKHDVTHLLASGLKKNNLIAKENVEIEKYIFKAVFRCEQLKYEYNNICDVLENARIPFLPLKGMVIRKYYPEEWMRTSCDIDILVHHEDLDKAVCCLSAQLQYTEIKRATHDVSIYSPSGVHIEIHFDLVEEGRANNAADVLKLVWKDAELHKGSSCWYEMSDAFFYFYHIAHMAKHFETGGCGIRPFIDLWLLEQQNNANQAERNALLSKGGLLKFAEVSRALCRMWFDNYKSDKLLLQMQDFILRGGVYGSADNRVALMQKKKGGRIGYIFSRAFIPFAKLKRYYPVLKKHPWLMPFMQIRRWFMMLDSKVAKMANREINANKNLDKEKAEEMHNLLDGIGLK